MREIVETFNVEKIFVFEVTGDGTDDERSFLLTFNIDKDDKDSRFRDYKEKYKNTVQLHRKKEFNTLYTINSLNAVVVEQNGAQDARYNVDWEPYRNTCLLSDKDNKLKVLETTLYDIVEL